MKQFLTLVFLIAYFVGASQNENIKIKTIDLAFNQNSTIESIEPGKYQFRFKNYAPAGLYDTISILVKNQEIKVLPAVVEGFNLLGGGDMFVEHWYDFFEDDDCNLKEKYNELMEISDEIEVKKFYNNIDFEELNCSGKNITLFDLKFEAATTWTSEEFEVRKGEYIEIVVKRIKSDEETIKKIFEYKTPKKGEWITSYGINIVTRMVMDEQHFFTKQMAGDSIFTILKEEDSNNVNFSAAAFFTYLPNNDRLIKTAFTAGIGTDTDNLSIYLGGSFVYATNVSLNFGISGHYKYQLLGKYSENETIKENLDFNQLHERKVAINPFIGLSFRFGKNPFSFSNSDEE